MAHSAPFRRSSFRLALAVGVATSSLFLAGCDNATSKSDKVITKQLDDASDKMNGIEADRSSAHSILDSASLDTTSSLPVRMRAKVLLADSELHSAQMLTARIRDNSLLIDRLARQIGLLGGEIQTNNIQVAGLQKYEPAKLQSAVSLKQSDLKGSDDKPDWIKSGDASLASLSADDKQAAALQAQVTQLQDTIKSESDQRNTLLEQADKFTQDSFHEQRQKSVDLYVQGSNARKQAADLSVKLDQDNVALTRAQADLSIRTGQHESLTTAMKGFDDKSAFYAQDWSAVQKEIADLNDKSKDLLAADPVSAPMKDIKKGDLTTQQSIGSKAAAIRALANTNHELRGQAEPHFNSAIDFYKQAGDLAQKIQTDIGNLQAKRTNADESPDAMALNEMKATADPAYYRDQQADATLQKAQFYATAAAEDKVRIELADRIKPILAAAQLTMLPTLDDSDGSIALNMKSAQSSAREAFQNSLELLTAVPQGTGGAEVKAGAQVQQIFAQYAWSQLEAAAGDAQKAAMHMELARTAVGTAIGDGTPTPALPPELGEGGRAVPVK